MQCVLLWTAYHLKLLYFSNLCNLNCCLLVCVTLFFIGLSDFLLLLLLLFKSEYLVVYFWETLSSLISTPRAPQSIHVNQFSAIPKQTPFHPSQGFYKWIDKLQFLLLFSKPLSLIHSALLCWRQASLFIRLVCATDIQRCALLKPCRKHLRSQLLCCVLFSLQGLPRRGYECSNTPFLSTQYSLFLSLLFTEHSKPQWS